MFLRAIVCARDHAPRLGHNLSLGHFVIYARAQYMNVSGC